VTFEEVWAEKEREGYQYGEDALEHVRFGYELAKDKAEEWRSYCHSSENIYSELLEKANAKLAAIRALAINSLDSRHGPGGCGIYATEIYNILDK